MSRQVWRLTVTFEILHLFLLSPVWFVGRHKNRTQRVFSRVVVASRIEDWSGPDGMLSATGWPSGLPK